MSAINDFVKRLKMVESRARELSSASVIVGWAHDAKAKKRPASKGAKKRNGAGSGDSDGQSASLATIAKTLCYGREGGTTKDGREYGRIPARNFVKVMQEKHMKPLVKTIAAEVFRQEKPDAPVDFDRIGVVAKGQLQRAMKDSNEYAPNAPITVHGGWMANPQTKKPFHVDPKGSERPLWDTGNLIRSVDFEIKRK